jgi:hypothetical protein
MQRSGTIRFVEKLTVTNSDQEAMICLVTQMQGEHGHLMTGELLWRTLGFKSSAAFRQAKSRGVINIRLFKIPNRRGTFAATADVAKWLYSISSSEEI